MPDPMLTPLPTPNPSDSRWADAEAIFRAALARVDPVALVQTSLRYEGNTLHVEAGEETATYNLNHYHRILVTGMGKATARLALGLEQVLGDRIDEGLVVVKTGHGEPLRRIRTLEAGHPVPDAASVQAGEAILNFVAGMDNRTLVITLISGGGSALACAPGPSVSRVFGLDGKQALTRSLLACGATIQEINCVRKHLSRIKGGRLAAAMTPAESLNLLLSDVVGDELDTIASGPTVPDPTTYADALDVVRRYQADASVPFPEAPVRALVAGATGALPETPKRDDLVFARTRNFLLGTNRTALMAAEAKARELGYATMAITSRLTGEAREAALALLGIGEDIAISGFPLHPPACILAGGETTVTLRGPGRGGRNQEMALAFLEATGRSSAARGVLLLAASTDGTDGPTDAAGAFASTELAKRAEVLGLDPRAFLAANNSYTFHDRLGSLLRTGPTRTNVSDLAVMLVR